MGSRAWSRVLPATRGHVGCPGDRASREALLQEDVGARLSDPGTGGSPDCYPEMCRPHG